MSTNKEFLEILSKIYMNGRRKNDENGFIRY